MAAWQQALLVLVVAVVMVGQEVQQQHKVAMAADPDPLQDYCVGSNAVDCKDPATLTAADFTSQAFRAAANTSNALGIALGIVAGPTFPALNTQGLTLVKIDYDASGGLVPPHTHPRASEIIYVLRGAVQVGFVDTAGKFFGKTLYAGDLFVFPRGLVHYQYSPPSSHGPALSLSALNSQNPGLQLIPTSLFASSPLIPDLILSKSFAITTDDVAAIRKAFGIS